jgi:hypothetical protein
MQHILVANHSYCCAEFLQGNQVQQKCDGCWGQSLLSEKHLQQWLQWTNSGKVFQPGLQSDSM